MRHVILLVILMNMSAAPRADSPGPCPAPGCAVVDPDRAPDLHLRPLRDWIAQLLQEARPQSPTLDRLAACVESMPLIVHIDEAEGADTGWDGRIRFVGAGGGYRYLRIDLRRLPRAAAAAVLAHELQHALEVVVAGVSSRPEFDALYRRIGLETIGRQGPQYDTPAAVAAGIAAMAELSGPRTRSAHSSAGTDRQ